MTDKTSTAVAGTEPTRTVTPMELLDTAVSGGADVKTLEGLFALQERWEARQARSAFDAAISEAKAEIPIIGKTRKVDFTSQKGRTSYEHEDLAEISRVVSPILAKYGLSYRFRTSSAVNEPVTVTCIVSHRNGHSEENTLMAGKDESGNKNSIQAIGSTITYLQRYTLKAALGLAAGADDDGQAVTEKITQGQLEAIAAKIDRVKADAKKVCNRFAVSAIADLRADQYENVMASLAKFEEMRKSK